MARDRLPFLRRIGPEGVRHRAPSGVFGEQGFFRVGGVAVFGFDLFQRADGLDVVEGFFAKAAFADAVGFGYSESPGGCSSASVFEFVDDGLRRAVLARAEGPFLRRESPTPPDNPASALKATRRGGPPSVPALRGALLQLMVLAQLGDHLRMMRLPVLENPHSERRLLVHR